MTEKKCGHCKKSKYIDCYYKSKQNKNGLSSWCKECESDKKKKYQIENKEKIKEKRRQYHISNKEKENKYSKEYNLKNYSKIKEYQSSYFIENKDEILKKGRKIHHLNKESLNLNKKQYYINNQSKILKKHKERYQKNKKLIHKQRLVRHQERMKNDFLYNLKTKIRQSIRDTFKRTTNTKNQKTIDILGCSFAFFKDYIEKQFDENMNWENYGSYWWYDHIIPISLAKTEEEIYKLNHYTNFRPLFWRDNIIKSNKIN